MEEIHESTEICKRTGNLSFHRLYGSIKLQIPGKCYPNINSDLTLFNAKNNGKIML